MSKPFVLVLLSLIAVGCSTNPSTSTPVQTQTLAPASPTSSVARKSGRIRYLYTANLDARDVPILMALEALQAQGYVIEETPFATANLIVDSLARGDADIATLNNQAMWAAIAKGAKIRTVAQKTGSTAIVAAKQEIKSCGDLNGKTIALTGTTGMNPTLFYEYVKKNCPGTKTQIAVMPDTPGRVAAMLAGQVDAAQLQREEMLQLDRGAPGKFHMLASLTQDFSNVQVTGVHVGQEWAQQHPEIVRDFLRELLLANRRVNADHELLYKETVKRIGIDREAAEAIGDIYLEFNMWDLNGGLTKENTQYTIDFLTKANALPAGVKADQVADLSYLNAVLDEIGRR